MYVYKSEEYRLVQYIIQSGFGGFGILVCVVCVVCVIYFNFFLIFYYCSEGRVERYTAPSTHKIHSSRLFLQN